MILVDQVDLPSVKLSSLHKMATALKKCTNYSQTVGGWNACNIIAYRWLRKKIGFKRIPRTLRNLRSDSCSTDLSLTSSNKQKSGCRCIAGAALRSRVTRSRDADVSLVQRNDRVTGSRDADVSLVQRNDRVTGSRDADVSLVQRNDRVTGSRDADVSLVQRNDRVTGSRDADVSLVQRNDRVTGSRDADVSLLQRYDRASNRKS